MVIYMRIRKKKWAAPELADCPFFIDEPAAYKGRWKEAFADKDKPLYAEFGCGKGGFAAQAALAHPDVNWLAVDIKNDMLAVASRTIKKLFSDAGREVANLRITAYNISNVSAMFSEYERLCRIYVNFCNPWPRPKHHKRRLTHVRQLVQYRQLLEDGGEIHFKTDDDQLFEESVPYFEKTGFEIRYITRDLHNSGYEHNIMTEHERMFTEEGKTIKFLIAVKKPWTPPEDMTAFLKEE